MSVGAGMFNCLVLVNLPELAEITRLILLGLSLETVKRRWSDILGRNRLFCLDIRYDAT